MTRERRRRDRHAPGVGDADGTRAWQRGHAGDEAERVPFWQRNRLGRTLYSFSSPGAKPRLWWARPAPG